MLFEVILIVAYVVLTFGQYDIIVCDVEAHHLMLKTQGSCEVPHSTHGANCSVETMQIGPGGARAAGSSPQEENHVGELPDVPISLNSRSEYHNRNACQPG